MRPSIDTTDARKWLETRRQVQVRAEVVLGEAAEYFLYRGKLYGEGAPGQSIAALLGSAWGCSTVLWLIERLDAEEALEAVVVDDEGREPDAGAKPVLKLLAGHLSHLWPNGHREPV